VQHLKKYGAVIFLLLTFLIARTIANNLIIDQDKAVYNYIPQSADIIVEVNTRNFVTELLNQRFFHADYFLSRIPIDEDEEGVSDFLDDAGIDLFSKLTFFRESWANEAIWVGLIKFTNKADFKEMIEEALPEHTVLFGSSHAIIQLSPTKNQDRVDNYLKEILAQSAKPITNRVNLTELFDDTQEINCYFFPEVDKVNPILDGMLSFNFTQDKVEISGKFTPAAGTELPDYIHYLPNDETGLSVRSTLNVLNDLMRGANLQPPANKEFAIDYDGIGINLVNRSVNGLPFIVYPNFYFQAELVDNGDLFPFLSNLSTREMIDVDTVKQRILTSVASNMSYKLEDSNFIVYTDSAVQSIPTFPSSNSFLDIRMNIQALLAKTTFGVDATNPPSGLEQTIGLAFADNILSSIKYTMNMSTINFEMTEDDEKHIIGAGKIQFMETEGHAVVESVFFGRNVFGLLKSFDFGF
jgi:hypothetical protein